MKKALKLLALTLGLLLIVGLIMMTVLQLGGQKSVDGLLSLSQFLEREKLIFTVFRLSLILMVFWQWESLGRWLADKRHWDKDLYQLFLQIKWKVLAWILVFEVVVNQNLIAYLFN